MSNNNQPNAAVAAEAKARSIQLLRRCETLIGEATKEASSDQIELAKQHVLEIERLIGDQHFPADIGAHIRVLCKRIVKDANDIRTQNLVIGMFSNIITGGR